MKLSAVLRVALDAGDDEQMRVLRGRGASKPEEDRQRDTQETTR